MRQTYLKGQFPAGNPIANVLVIIAGALVIAVSVVLGFFAFVALSAIVLISAAVIGIRVWWLSRKLKAAAPAAASESANSTSDSTTVIEGEYRVLDGDDDKT